MKLRLVLLLISLASLVFSVNMSFDDVDPNWVMGPTVEFEGATWNFPGIYSSTNGNPAPGMLSWSNPSSITTNQPVDIHSLEAKPYFAETAMNLVGYSDGTEMYNITITTVSGEFTAFDIGFYGVDEIVISSGFYFDNVDVAVSGAPGHVAGLCQDLDGVAIEGAVISIGDVSTTSNASGEYTLNDVASGNVTITSSATDYVPFSASINVPSGGTVNYDIAMTFLEVSDEASEDFETGDITLLPWIISGEGTWSICDVNPFNGTYCLKSDPIEHNSSADFSITMNILEAGVVTFASKVSSELDYDFLKFYIDGEVQNETCGETEWILPEDNAFTVSEGLHSFSWKYEKDAADPDDLTAEDCAWIDDITFPLFAGYGTISGLVDNQDNEVLENAFISLNDSLFTTTSDASGSYNFSSIPAGNYNVTVTLASYLEYTGTVEVVADQNTVNDIELEAVAVFGLTGTVTDVATGNAISGAIISLDATAYYSTQSDANGEFVLTGFEGGMDYYLAVYAPGYQGHYETVTITGDLNLGTVQLTELLYPATGITAENNVGNADISWESPLTSHPDYFRYDNGLTGWGTGTSNIVGSPNHLMGNVFYCNAIINNVEFCMFDYSTSGPHENKAKVVIYGLGEDGYPDGDRLLHESEWLTVMEGYDQWNYYELPEPVEAPNGYIVGLRGNEAVTTEFWVAYCYNDYTPDWPAQYGDSYRIYDVLADDPAYSPVTNGDNYANLLIRANGFIIEELDNRPSPPGRTADSIFEDAPGNRNINNENTLISQFGNSYPNTSRAVESYDIYLLLADDSGDATLWSEVATDISGNSYTDNNFSDATTGTYQYAIYANYTGDLQSGAKLSTYIGADMLANVNLNITTANGTSTENARIRLYGDDQYAPALGLDFYEFYMGENNTINTDIWKQTYKIYVDLEGYEQYIQESVYVFGDTDIDVTLVDRPVPAYGVNIETTDTGEVISWLPAEEKVLLDHHGALASSGVPLIDYPSDDWGDFDREGLFDITIEETVVLSKMVLPVKIFWNVGQNYPMEDYPEPVSFAIKVYENENGTPALTHVDSTSTIPVVFNDFHEYSAVLEDPIVLQPGTYWLGAQAQLPPYPAWPDAPEGHFCNIRFARTLALHNGSGYFWRMPYDGYNMGYDEWYQLDTDLKAYVVGRPLTPETRSVESYDIYRLDEDSDEDDITTWDTIQLGCTELNCFDNTIEETGIYRYAIVANFPNGAAEAAFSSEEMLSEPEVDGDNPAVPMVTSLIGNYPNPFNPTTTISFSLKEESNVTLEIYNIKGQKVKSMKQENLAAGNHKLVWNGTDNDANNVSSGIYFYKMHSRNYTATKKMILMK